MFHGRKAAFEKSGGMVAAGEKLLEQRLLGKCAFLTSEAHVRNNGAVTRAALARGLPEGFRATSSSCWQTVST